MQSYDLYDYPVSDTPPEFDMLKKVKKKHVVPIARKVGQKG